MEHHETIKTRALPIIAYGNHILRKTCYEIEQQDQETDTLITNLWDTLNISGGVGLASPQINLIYQAFVVNSKLMYDDLDDQERNKFFPDDEGIQETFINARIIDKSEKTWSETEGCLSIPGINEPVKRQWEITVEYLNKDFQLQKKQFSGYTAKVIQHEFDHTNGILFIDYLAALKKKLLRGKLKRITDGKVETEYPIQFLKHR